jgi:cytochrome c peroxidase
MAQRPPTPALALLAALACAPQPPGDAAPPLGLDLYLPAPPDDPPTAARVELGRRLFHDTALSADSSLACASCHRPDHAFTDTVPQPAGVYGRTGRNAPSLHNAGYATSFAWDGRSDSIEEQVLRAIADPAEMALPHDRLAARLGAEPDYAAAFRSAFGPNPTGDITPGRAARALAAYLRTLRAGDSRADRFRAGDTTALTPLERQGLDLFLGRANCVACHGGPLFSDGSFHNTGVGWGGADPGRAGVTGRAEDRGLFATPSLRDVARTPPYMHDGSLPSLEDVIAFYDGGATPNPLLDREIRPLGLSAAERVALVAYLRALTTRGPSAAVAPRR